MEKCKSFLFFFMKQEKKMAATFRNGEDLKKNKRSEIGIKPKTEIVQ